MEHVISRKQLWAFYDGELNELESQNVGAHLAVCTECRTVLEGWRSFAGKAFGMAPQSESEMFVQGVMARLGERESVRPRLIPVQWFAPVLGLAAMLLLALVPAREPMTAELFFMNGEAEASSHWMFFNGSPKTDEVLSFMLEDR